MGDIPCGRRRRRWPATDHIAQIVGKLRVVAEPRRQPFGPIVFAVAFDAAQRAVAHTVLKVESMLYLTPWYAIAVLYVI